MRKLFSLAVAVLFFFGPLQRGRGQISGLIRATEIMKGVNEFDGLVEIRNGTPEIKVSLFSYWTGIPAVIDGFKLYFNIDNNVQPFEPRWVFSKEEIWSDSVCRLSYSATVSCWIWDFEMPSITHLPAHIYFWIEVFAGNVHGDPLLIDEYLLKPVEKLTAHIKSSDLVDWEWEPIQFTDFYRFESYDPFPPYWKTQSCYLYETHYEEFNWTETEQARVRAIKLDTVAWHQSVSVSDFVEPVLAETKVETHSIFQFQLSQNYPNPFNPETEIHYQLPRPCYVTLKIYNLLGQEVRTLVDQEEPAGYHTVRWDGKGTQGQDPASGIYVYQIEAGQFVAKKKMTLVK